MLDTNSGLLERFIKLIWMYCLQTSLPNGTIPIESAAVNTLGNCGSTEKCGARATNDHTKMDALGLVGADRTEIVLACGWPTDHNGGLGPTVVVQHLLLLLGSDEELLGLLVGEAKGGPHLAKK